MAFAPLFRRSACRVLLAASALGHLAVPARTARATTHLGRVYSDEGRTGRVCPHLAWLVYLPCAGDQQTPSVLPLALDFEGVLLLDLTGVFILLAAGEARIERLRDALRKSSPDIRPVLRAALDAAETAANALASLDDVRDVAQLQDAGLRVLQPDPLGDVVRPSSLAEGAAHVLERVQQAREVL